MKFSCLSGFGEDQSPNARRASVLIPANSQSFDSWVQRAAPGTGLPTRLWLHTALLPPAWDASGSRYRRDFAKWIRGESKTQTWAQNAVTGNTDESFPFLPAWWARDMVWGCQAWAHIMAESRTSGFSSGTLAGPSAPPGRGRVHQTSESTFFQPHRTTSWYYIRSGKTTLWRSLG